MGGTLAKISIPNKNLKGDFPVLSSLTLLSRNHGREKKAFKTLAYILLPFFDSAFHFKGVVQSGFLRVPLRYISEYEVEGIYFSFVPCYLKKIEYIF